MMSKVMRLRVREDRMSVRSNLVVEVSEELDGSVSVKFEEQDDAPLLRFSSIAAFREVFGLCESDLEETA